MLAMGIAVLYDLPSQLKLPLQPQNMSRHSSDDFSGVVRGGGGQACLAVAGPDILESRPAFSSFARKAISRGGRYTRRLECDVLDAEEMPIVV
jgi:hypothetical protein